MKIRAGRLRECGLAARTDCGNAASLRGRLSLGGAGMRREYLGGACAPRWIRVDEVESRGMDGRCGLYVSGIGACVTRTITNVGRAFEIASREECKKCFLTFYASKIENGSCYVRHADASVSLALSLKKCRNPTLLVRGAFPHRCNLCGAALVLRLSHSQSRRTTAPRIYRIVFNKRVMSYRTPQSYRLALLYSTGSVQGIQ